MDKKDFVTDAEHRYLDRILPGQADAILDQLEGLPGETLQERLRESLQTRKRESQK